MRTIQIFRLAAVVAASSAAGRHARARRALWSLLAMVKRAERAAMEQGGWYDEPGAAWTAALERERKGLHSAAYRRGQALAAAANRESGGAL